MSINRNHRNVSMNIGKICSSITMSKLTGCVCFGLPCNCKKVWDRIHEKYRQQDYTAADPNSITTVRTCHQQVHITKATSYR